jgi:hypothetical protein
MVGLYDRHGVMLAWTVIPQHADDLRPAVAKAIESTFEPYLGRGWLDE